MTLARTYDALLGIAARPEHARRVAEMRRTFEERTGHFGHDEETSAQRGAHVDDAWLEARSRAFWDDALTRQGFAREAGGELGAEARGWVVALGRAHRGLFTPAWADGRLVLVDLWSGAELVIDEIDEASSDAVDAASAPFDARVAACWEGAEGRMTEGARLVVALLPGAVFHPAEAEGALKAVLRAARAKAMGADAVLDALLRMERALKTLSRVKPAYAYRTEALVAKLT